MGVDIHVMRIDRRAYARVVDVHRRWVEERDSAAVLAVLGEALDRVRKLAPSGQTRLQRMEELGRRIDALPTTPQDEEGRLSGQRDSARLGHRETLDRTIPEPPSARYVAGFVGARRS